MFLGVHFFGFSLFEVLQSLNWYLSITGKFLLLFFKSFCSAPPCSFSSFRTLMTQMLRLLLWSQVTRYFWFLNRFSLCSDWIIFIDLSSSSLILSSAISTLLWSLPKLILFSSKAFHSFSVCLLFICWDYFCYFKSVHHDFLEHFAQ